MRCSASAESARGAPLIRGPGSLPRLANRGRAAMATRPGHSISPPPVPPGLTRLLASHRIAVRRDVHVAHDVAAAGNGPGLEFLGLRVEAHDGVRLGAGLVVPDRALGEDDAVGLRLRPARRRPLLDLAGREIEPAEDSRARSPRTRRRRRAIASRRGRDAGFGSVIFLDRQRLRIDGGDLVGAEQRRRRECPWS